MKLLTHVTHVSVSLQFPFSGAEHLRPFLKSVFSFLFHFFCESWEHISSRKNLSKRWIVFQIRGRAFEKSEMETSAGFSSCSRHSQTVQDPNWDTKDHSLDVPLQYIPQGKRDAPFRYAAKEPEEKRSFSFKFWRQEGVWPSADHLREERLAIHVHSRHVEPTYVQNGWSQVDVQDGSLEESGDKMRSNKNGLQQSFCALCVVTSTVWFGAIPGPRTMSGTLMSNSYSCLLSMGNENWPEHGEDSKTGVRGSRRLPRGADDGAAQTCVVAVVRGEDDVGAVQLVDVIEFLHQLFHHVVHGDQRLPPAGWDRFFEAFQPFIPKLQNFGVIICIQPPDGRRSVLTVSCRRYPDRRVNSPSWDL